MGSCKTVTSVSNLWAHSLIFGLRGVVFLWTPCCSCFRVSERKQWESCDIDSDHQCGFGAGSWFHLWRILDSYWRKPRGCHCCGKLSSDQLCSWLLLWFHKTNAVIGELCGIFDTGIKLCTGYGCITWYSTRLGYWMYWSFHSGEYFRFVFVEETHKDIPIWNHEQISSQW